MTDNPEGLAPCPRCKGTRIVPDQSGDPERIPCPTCTDGTWASVHVLRALRPSPPLPDYNDEISPGQCAEIAHFPSPPLPDAALREARELLRQAGNLLGVIADNKSPDEPISDNGMTIWDGLTSESKRLYPRISAAIARAALENDDAGRGDAAAAMRAALRFYGDPASYVSTDPRWLSPADMDKGAKARDAMENDDAD